MKTTDLTLPSVSVDLDESEQFDVQDNGATIIINWLHLYGSGSVQARGVQRLMSGQPGVRARNVYLSRDRVPAELLVKALAIFEEHAAVTADANG